jgi:hypothetical protein
MRDATSTPDTAASTPLITKAIISPFSTETPARNAASRLPPIA